MKKKIILSVLVMLFVNSIMFSEMICQFPELTNPSQIVIGHDQIYFADGATVYIYSLKTHKLIKKFGRKGEGPEEFQYRIPNRTIKVILKKDCFYVSSLNKISRYKINGDFINEKKYKARLTSTIPVGERYAAKGLLAEKKDFFYTVNIYDKQFKVIKELYREKLDPRNKINPIDATGPEILVLNDNIYINNTRNRNCLNIFNSEGKLLHDIKDISPPILLTEKIKNNFIYYLKNDPKFKRIYERLKNRLVFPKYLPLIRFIYTDNKNLIALTYPDANKKKSIYIFNLDGKFIKKIDSPLVSLNVEEVHPFTLYKGKLYQIVENDEEWELHKFNL